MARLDHWLVAALCAVACPVLAADDAALAAAKVRITEKYPHIQADAIHESPIEGVLEIAMGGQIAYVTIDGRYLLQGDLVDLDTSVNLTEQRRNGTRAAALAEVDEQDMIVFSPDKVKHTVTVFTDVDCGYCRKLHQEMAELNALGLRVRYVFFPRTGPDTPSWTTAERVWCAADRNAALTAAKAGKPFDSKECGATPVMKQWELGHTIGLTGTPGIVTEQGALIAGYLPAAELAERVATLSTAAAPVAQAAE
ncbi:MAG: DsbC family protein [Gammaproteobacteria bacterium]|nr:DsbC family protein [Gammaproteobacteria bacterium]